MAHDGGVKKVLSTHDHQVTVRKLEISAKWAVIGALAAAGLATICVEILRQRGG